MPVSYDKLAKLEKEALVLLAKAKIQEPKIIRTSGEAILFTQGDKPSSAWTAWLSDDGKSILRLDRGFVADY